jgi:heptaprenylglyceryl phosphate synthase
MDEIADEKNFFTSAYNSNMQWIDSLSFLICYTISNMYAITLENTLIEGYVVFE